MGRERQRGPINWRGKSGKTFIRFGGGTNISREIIEFADGQARRFVQQALPTGITPREKLPEGAHLCKRPGDIGVRLKEDQQLYWDEDTQGYFLVDKE